MVEIKPGIYLERKKGIIGTGNTAKETEYRNFWMTLEQTGEIVHCVLLNSDFMLTTVTEDFSADRFEPPRFVYIEQGEKRYQLLKQQLEEKKSKKEAANGSAIQKSTQAKPANWWETPQKEIQPGDLFKQDGTARKPKTPSVQDGPDIFSRPQTQPSQQVSSKKKTKKSEVVLKKNWWSS
jgi:hypothetical protein